MTEQQKESLERLVARALASIGAENVPVRLERPKAAAMGDVACTSAMQGARILKKSPREIAAMIVSAMRSDPECSRLLSSVEIAGPGFINLRFNDAAKFEVVREVLRRGAAYGSSAKMAGRSVLLEYVSANPTGPLHLGHARQGALGDVLARVMATQGCRVMREFYYNDAGVQIGKLAASVQARAREQAGLAGPESFPGDGYHGEYIADIAKSYLARTPVRTKRGEAADSKGDIEDLDAIRRYAVAYLRGEQDEDLAALGVAFDNFYLESSLYSSGRVQETVAAIIASGKTYEKDGALWLKTTDEAFSAIHDDKDRVMRKADGTFTYFVPDVAYHIAKFERGFDRAINIQGSDHFGTTARVRIGLQAAAPAFGLSIPAAFPEYMLHKMLRVMKDGREQKMSKRAGTYVTLRDLVDWVGRDAARFFLVERKPDAEFVFDVDLARSKSDENPVFYLQYAHARICSVLAQAAERGYAVPSEAEAAACDLSPLSGPQAAALALRLAEYGATLYNAARDLTPHLICVYLKELAADFHSFYNAERVLVEDKAERTARLALLMAARRVLANGLDVLGISAPERM